MKKLLCVLVVVLCAMSMIFANGAAEKKEKKVTITMLDAFVPGEALTNAWNASLEKYLAENPNVEIDEETISNSDLTVKVQTLAAADELPDVFCLKGQMAAAFIKNGKVLDLTSLLESDPEWAGTFKDGVFSNFTSFDGHIYALPYQITNTCVFYNAEIFEKAGISSFPTTWEEFVAVCKTLKEQGITPIVLGNVEKWNAESVIMSTLGNRVSGNDWYESIKNGTGAKFTDPEFVNALKALEELVEVGAFNSDVNSIDGAQQRMVFMNGNAAMTIDGTWALSDFDSNCPDDVKKNIRIAALPAVESGKGDPNAISGGAGWALAINSSISEEKKDIALNFIKSILSQDFAAMMAATGTPTAQIPSEYELPESATTAREFNEFQEGRSYVPVYDHQLSSGVIQVMQSGLQELLAGTTTAEELASAIQAEYEKN